MADNKDPNKSPDGNDSLDDDFDLDLDLFAESDSDENEDDMFTIADSDDEFTEPELEDNLHDDLTDDLESDMIDLSDEEVQAEFAALEREVSRAEASETRTPSASGDNELNLDDPAAAFSAAMDDADQPNRKRKIEDDPDMSDDLDSVLSKEEFGVPDQDYRQESTQGATSDKDNEKSAREKIMALGNSLPALLAPLANLSPKVIVAATAVVLLPLVIFAVLGINSGGSDANGTGNTQATSVATDAGSSSQTLPEPPASTTESMPALPAEILSAYVVEEPAAESITEQSAEATAPESSVGDESIPVTDDTESDLIVAADTEQEQPGVDGDVSEETVDTELLFAQTQDEETATATGTDANAELATEQAPEETALPNAAQPGEDEIASVADTDADSEELLPEAPVDVSAPESSENAESPATTAARIADTTSTGRDYHIIVASFPNAAQAQTHADRISDEEISAYVIPPFASANNYRVAVASYTSMSEALTNIPGLRAVYGEGIWPLRYPPAAEVALLTARTGDTFIIVASFPSEELARTHADTLVATSEQPAIIAPYAPANRYRVAVARFDSIESAQAALPGYRQEYGQDLWLLSY